MKRCDRQTFANFSFGNFRPRTHQVAARWLSAWTIPARSETAALFSASYGFVVGSVFRLAAEYDHALIWDAAAGYSGTSFGGAGVNGQLPGPWATLLQLSAGAPVVGRDKGQTGFVLSFSVLKIF